MPVDFSRFFLDAVTSGGTRSVTTRLFIDMKKLWKACTFSFLEAALDKIHVDTGMSAASLMPLAAKVQVRSQIEAQLAGMGTPTKPGHKTLYGRWASNNAEFKSRTLGEQLGKKSFALTYGDANNPIFSFDFEIAVFQLYLHETSENWMNERGGRKSQNWHAIEAGYFAFLKHFDDNVDSYINVDRFAQIMLEGERGGADLVEEGDFDG